MTDNNLNIEALTKRLDEISTAVQKPDILLGDAAKLLLEAENIAVQIKEKIEAIRRQPRQNPTL